MKDTIIKSNGKSRILKAPTDMPETFEAWRTQLLAGSATLDIGLNAAGCEVVGTPLNKATLLSDTTVTKLELNQPEPTVNQAIEKLAENASTDRITIENRLNLALHSIAFHTAHRALESLHADTLGDRRRNLLLADFSKTGQWSSLYHLNVTSDLKKPVPATEVSSEWSMTKIEPTGGSVYRGSDGLTQTIAEFTATHHGSVTSVLLVDSGSGGDGSTRTLTMLEDGVAVATGTFTTTSSSYVVKTINMAFTMTAGKTYTLQITFPTSSKSFSMGTTTSQSGYAGKVFPLLQGTGTTYSSGYFLTPEVAVKQPGTLHLWLVHSGTVPAVEIKNNDGSWVQITAAETDNSVQSVSSVTGTRRGYTHEGINSGTLQLRVTLPDATSAVEEIAGVIV